ncbi:MAG: ATP-dependent sacrificial sulfur transferase LarE [bacterium]|nr:ATP-dependent sacrificial sulfur transferase LarE [bacterium]
MELQEFFKTYPKAALGFSGGVDSAYLLYAAKKYGCNIQPYYIKTQFQPEFELRDADRLCRELKIELKIIPYNILLIPNVVKNPKNRCYFCKANLFSALREQAVKDGYTTIIDGTNASDDSCDRPGMKALCELNVLSPLRLCGLTKSDVRRLSKDAGLFTWNKPSYACLATRIPTGSIIKQEMLQYIEASENILTEMGYSDFRVRYFNGSAKIQLKKEQFEKAFKERKELVRHLKPYFESVLLDLEER